MLLGLYYITPIIQKSLAWTRDFKLFTYMRDFTCIQITIRSGIHMS
jgi:hypothetical protein